jgi:aldose 1-epimerase
MVHSLQALENDVWQAGILPETGASVAFGRIKKDGTWVDVLRPTAEADYGNSSNSSSFIMLPWCNRIKDAKLRFNGKEYALQPTPDDGTARHGDVRKRAWHIVEQSRTHLRMAFDSRQHSGVNFPFQFSTSAEYRLEGRSFIWRLSLKNEDSQPMPGGFGHHPYFVRPVGVNTPRIQIPCDAQFNLVNDLAVAPPVPLEARLDFRKLRPLEDGNYDDLLTHRQDDQPVRIVFPRTHVEIAMYSDPIFKHIVLYAPQGKPFVAVEPMTNANDGFNLYEQGIDESGVFVLQPGEERSGTVRLVTSH